MATSNKSRSSQKSTFKNRQNTTSLLPDKFAKKNWKILAVVLAVIGLAGTVIWWSQSRAASANQGIWISQEELNQLPTTGASWDSIVSTAEGSLGTANVSDQNSKHGHKTLAAALVAARTGRADMRQKAMDAMLSAIDTEEGARWLAIGRSLSSYIIAADVLGIRNDTSADAVKIHNWLARFNTRTLSHNNSTEQITLKRSAWFSGSNASAQEGFTHAALNAYLGNSAELDWNWTAFKRYTGDRTSTHIISSNNDSWQEVSSDPIGIQKKGVTKSGCRLDGAISNDMSRGGDFSCTPGYTQYPWVGLSGAVPAAVILQRAGYDAFTVNDSAILRAAEFLMYVQSATGNNEWYDGSRAADIKFLINKVYGKSFPGNVPTGFGSTIGYTDWTFANGIGTGGVVSPPPSGDTTAPSVPGGLNAVAGNGSVGFSWTASTDNIGVTGYDVRYKLASSSSWESSVAVTGTSRTVTSLTNGSVYDFSVRSKDAAGNVSAWSSTISAAPQATSTTRNPGDVNGDKTVNGIDLSEVLTHYGQNY